MEISSLLEHVGTAIDVVGVGVMVIGALAATWIAATARRGGPGSEIYEPYRRNLGRSILLGLEFLVAADIIKTVAVTPTFTSVGVLAVIVLIRTFLSWSLQLEIDGRWPWQRSVPESETTTGTTPVT
ncbi:MULTISPECIES: DUF1622 domain-containing protein [Rhodococcus]|uniref:Putative membrane protein n=1 Tax=Rhodococcus rhodochrous J45 TaxID=935266 RepID=A0A562E655_RHORH|nr:MULTISPECIES: DUF1622 domain-containing protein [Rhodococcus]AYA26248.1 DUF1622 domain-containing protein [Rhodococcus rhodochrous]OWY80755.1 hypothetical protein B9C99_15530 [Rhodococcus sp. BUPNP1]TWH17164.1 putative membrane protein [Rhodococcus rhodochrous J45]BDB60377.1 membrane protein [Rhodococcus sp. RDE2]